MSDQDHNENLRDLASMFLMNALVSKYNYLELTQADLQSKLGALSYELADSLLAAKNPQAGITSVKRRKRNDAD
jgi:hypothetical protein